MTKFSRTPHQASKIAPTWRNLSPDVKGLLTPTKASLGQKLDERSSTVYIRALKTFFDWMTEFSEFNPESLDINKKHLVEYASYLEARKVNVKGFLKFLLSALNAALPGQFDRRALRQLIAVQKTTGTGRRKKIMSVPLGALSDDEKAFVDHIRQKYGIHRGDDYLRFVGHMTSVSPRLLTLDFRQRFLQPVLEPVLLAWLGGVNDAGSLQRFHLIATALDAYLGVKTHRWLHDAIRARQAALALPPKRKGTTTKGPGRSSRPRLKTRADMRTGPLLALMEQIAPTAQSSIRSSHASRSFKRSSRKLIDGDVLDLINARILKGIGSPDDPACEVFSLPSLEAMVQRLQHKMIDPRTIGRTCGRLRMLHRRIFPADRDHGCLYLSVIGREHFLSKPPKRRDVSHIDYLDLLTRVERALAGIEENIQSGPHRRNSLLDVERRDLLIVGVMLSTGLRITNVHGLRSDWIHLGPKSILVIPASMTKNSHTFPAALPDWLVRSLVDYAPDLKNPLAPAFPIWRSRDQAPLSLASVDRSIRKTSLTLIKEPLQPHDYRRLRCAFLQDSDDIDPMTANQLSGHAYLDTLLTHYRSRKVPEYLGGLLAPVHMSASGSGLAHAP